METTNHDLPKNHIIQKELGSSMIKNLQAAVSKSELPFEIPLAYNFNRNIFDKILRDQDCETVRIYFGLNDENRLCIIFVGADANQDDIYLPIKDAETEEKTLTGVADMGEICLPPIKKTYNGAENAITLP